MPVNSLLYIFPFPIFTSSSGSSNAFPYTEPHMVELLTITSFLLLLNVARTVADYVLHGGIIAEMVLGMIYGRPLAGILPSSWEETFTVLGYLGLIGIVFEGGLSTNLELLFANLPLSLLCALTGVGLPVAFSFALLIAGFGYQPLEAFAAGAALSSTSLGTTLMALNSVNRGSVNPVVSDGNDNIPKTEGDNGSTRRVDPAPPLQKSRIGTVLISAAVIDDVVGLVLASLIPALSVLNNTSQHLNRGALAWTIIRPILSSSLMAFVTPIVTRYILRPIFRYRQFGLQWCTPRQPWGSPRLLNLLTRNHDADRQWGTQKHADAVSVLFMILFISAFSTIAFYAGSSVLFGAYLAGLSVAYISKPVSDNPPSPGSEESDTDEPYFEGVYGRTIGQLQGMLLAPLFFASIGYAIPFISLWQPLVIWRGFVYALLMGIAKLCVGIPIILWGIFSRTSESYGRDVEPLGRLRNSVYPALFLGIAMVARGEIGLLIAQLARVQSSSTSNGTGLLGEEAFLVCIWAILLCTLFSPIGVGFILQRMRSKIVHGIWA